MFEQYKRNRNKRHALKWVNKVTGQSLTELPRGVQGAANACVLAKALETGIGEPVSVSGPTVVTSRNYYVLPKKVRQFIGDFDRGYYPELILQSRSLTVKLVEEAFTKFLEEGPTAMDIKVIPDTETTHTPLESPVPGKEVLPAPPEVPAVPREQPAPEREPVKV